MWNKFFNLFTILTLFSLVIAPVGRVSAQESGSVAKKMPFHQTGEQLANLKESTRPGASGPQVITGNLVQDPSFEASVESETFWGQFSSNFATPLCTFSDCGGPGGIFQPHTGNVWGWFGGINFSNPGVVNPSEDDMWQNVTFPSCGGATLEFYFRIPGAQEGADENDRFTVFIDGINVWSANATQTSIYPSYTLIRVDVSQFANGAVHLLEFYSVISDQNTNFFLDDVSLTGCPAISGNAGVAGATINYTGGSTIANGSGNYSFDVLPGWSGTVTPSRQCYQFTPANRSYNNVRTNQPAQNYTAAVGPACAAIAVRIKGVLQGGTRLVPKNNTIGLSFPVNSGPVIVNSTNGVPFVASQRVIFPKGGNPTFFSEMMGLPANIVGARYSFPAYDNTNFNSQLRVANVGNATATVRLFIKGSEKTSGCTPSNSPFTLAKGTTIQVSCAANDGPVVLQSSGPPIIASLRVVPKSNNGSFSEIMGLPQNQVSPSYFFPWYNNVGLNTQLRVANVGAATTTVTVTIGGVVRGSCNLAPNTSCRVGFASVNTGPVQVTSSGGVPIVASMRILFPKSGVAPFTGFSEIMGLPQSQLGTTYHFPWHNNANLDTQLRVANLSAMPASVQVFIGGQEVAGSPFTLAAGASTSKNFAGINKGPVKVVSNRVILASLRFLFPKNSNTPTFVSEVMGLPQNRLTTSYYFPWFDNVSLDTQLRAGVP